MASRQRSYQQVALLKCHYRDVPNMYSGVPGPTYKVCEVFPWYPIISITHWGRMTHICVSKLTIIGSDNGLSPERRQANIWINAGILLIGTLGTYFSEISIGIQTFSFKKMHLKMSSAKWRPFCLGLNVLIFTEKIGQIIQNTVQRTVTRALPGPRNATEYYEININPILHRVHALTKVNSSTKHKQDPRNIVGCRAITNRKTPVSVYS